MNPERSSHNSWHWKAVFHAQPELAAAAAKSLQSCPTLCNSIDGSPPGSPSLGFSRQEYWSALPFPSSMHESEKWKWSCSVMSNSLQPHELQHARPPCLSPTPGVHQTHVHWVGDAIQLSHPLLSPSPPALKLSQHQGLFKWVSPLHQVAKVLEFQLQYQSLRCIYWLIYPYLYS